MWSELLPWLPALVILVIAIVVCGADLIKSGEVWASLFKKKREEKQAIIQMGKDLAEIKESLKKTAEKQEELEEKIKDLVTSDMHDIKGWIVEQYQKFYNGQGWIDAFSAEVLDKRYEDYKKEGGNSYITTLMERLHSLPMDPPNRPQ